MVSLCVGLLPASLMGAFVRGAVGYCVGLLPASLMWALIRCVVGYWGGLCLRRGVYGGVRDRWVIVRVIIGVSGR